MATDIRDAIRATFANGEAPDLIIVGRTPGFFARIFARLFRRRRSCWKDWQK